MNLRLGRQRTPVALMALACLMLPGCIASTTVPYIGLERHGEEYTLLVMSCDKSTVDELQFGRGDDLDGDVQTKLSVRFGVGPRDTFEFQVNGLVPPSVTSGSPPEFPFFAVVRFSDGTAQGLFETPPLDGQVEFTPDDAESTTGSRQAFVDTVQEYCRS